MGKENWNIVQAEFFHVIPPPGTHIEELRAMCADRYVDGLPIKTNVRFYDKKGVVTKAIAEIDRINLVREVWEKRMYKMKSGSMLQRMCGRRHGTHFSKIMNMKRGLVRTLFQQFVLAMDDSSDIALEDDNHKFRIMSAKEVTRTHQLIEGVGQAWTFVFAPNDDLCAGKNKVIASVL